MPLKSRDAMTHQIETVGADQPVQHAARIMRDANVGILPVREHGRLVGMITDRDITVRATARGFDAGKTPVREVMTPDAIYCFEDEPLVEAARLMAHHAVRRLAVLDRNLDLVGILSRDDLLALSRTDAGVAVPSIVPGEPRP